MYKMFDISAFEKNTLPVLITDSDIISWIKGAACSGMLLGTKVDIFLSLLCLYEYPFAGRVHLCSFILSYKYLPFSILFGKIHPCCRAQRPHVNMFATYHYWNSLTNKLIMTFYSYSFCIECLMTILHCLAYIQSRYKWIPSSFFVLNLCILITFACRIVIYIITQHVHLGMMLLLLYSFMALLIMLYKLMRCHLIISRCQKR